MRLKRRLKETRQVMNAASGRILLFELAFRLLTLPFLLQLAGSLVRLSLKASGYSYVTAGNLGSFLTHPAAILAVLTIGAVFLFVLMLEIGGVMTAFQAAAFSRKISAFAMLTGGLSKTAHEIKRRNWKLFLIIAVHYILTNLFVIYRLLCHVKPVKFILPGLLGESWGRLLIVVFLTACVVVSIPTAFVGFGCMVEQRSFRGSLERSRELLSGNYVQTSLILVVCNAAVHLAAFLVYLFAILLVAVFAVRFLDQRIVLALILAARDKIELVILLMTSIVSVIVNYGALTVMYIQYDRREKHAELWKFGTGEDGAVSWMGRRNVLGLLAVVTAVSIASVYDAARNGTALADDLLYEVQITAHRGSSRTAPENTMPALEAAVDEMADYAEIDVQETKDGVLVLFHDVTLKRINGDRRAIRDLTYEELLEADAGGWFSEEYRGTRIPTLKEALDYARGRLKLNIEIKYMGTGSRLPEKVAAFLEEEEFTEQCVVTSTSLTYLERVKAEAPDLYTGYIVSAAYGGYYRNEAIDFISILSSSLDRKLADAVHESGKEIHVWTVNRRSEMERMKLLGADNVITDNPLLAREVLYGEENTENLLVRIREMLR